MVFWYDLGLWPRCENKFKDIIAIFRLSETLKELYFIKLT